MHSAWFCAVLAVNAAGCGGRVVADGNSMRDDCVTACDTLSRCGRGAPDCVDNCVAVYLSSDDDCKSAVVDIERCWDEHFAELGCDAILGDACAPENERLNACDEAHAEG